MNSSFKGNNKIKMRTNKSDNPICKVCSHTRKNSLEFFDIAFTPKHIITVCDNCLEDLFNKTLKANCQVNAKLKSQKDLAIIQNRRVKKQKD